MAYIARRLVSTNKIRLQEDGYDLDLSYITPQIIAMGFPCDGVSSLYRNPAGQVRRFLEERHGERFRVYNLCVERGYDSALFGGRVVRLPMYDGQAPPLHLMLEGCRDAAAWLAGGPDHVVAVHCKAGKGRTGAVVCALLIALEPQLGPASYDSVLAFWARQRTKDGKGLTIPSQRRFLRYFLQLLLLHATTAPPSLSPPPLNKTLNKTLGDEAPASIDEGTCSGTQDGLLGASLPLRQPEANADAVLVASSPPRTSAPTAAPSPALHLAVVPHRAVRLLRLRFRGLPMWLLRDCTASVWYRPVGHAGAHAVCHVHTAVSGGYGGCMSASSAQTVFVTSSGANWSIRQYTTNDDAASGSRGGGGGQGAWELDVCLSGVLPPALPLPAGQQSSGPQAPGTSTSDGAPVAAVSGPQPPPHQSQPPSVLSQSAPQRSASSVGVLEPLRTRATGTGTEGGRGGDIGGGAAIIGAGQESQDPQEDDKAPLLAGDIKIQMFCGFLEDPPHDIFKGRVTQFSAWISTAFLDPRAGVLELDRMELDKLHKRLRRWKGRISLAVEYKAVAE